MQQSLLDILVCPLCQASFRMDVFETEGPEILDGSLRCAGCESVYPIRAGVPRLLTRSSTNGDAFRTAQAFGWQWKRFSNLLLWHQQREQFLEWVAPLRPAHFLDRCVLDAGCGMGRLTEVAASFGPKLIVGIELSDAVEVAWWRLRGRPNVHLIQADIYHLPFRRGPESPFDLAYSTGVLHHLPDPRGGFEALLQHIKPTGLLSGWVYGKEGNAWIERFVDPVRIHITSRLPRSALLSLTGALSVPLHTAARAVRDLPSLRALPYAAYLDWLGRYSFRHTHHVVFDHLGPPIAYYLSREELLDWFNGAQVEQLSLDSRNSNSWRFLVRQPAEEGKTSARPHPEPQKTGRAPTKKAVARE